VAAAVALEAQKIYDEMDLFGHARRMSEPFQRHLKALDDHPLVGEAMGVGMVGAVELVGDKKTKAVIEPVASAGAIVAKHAQDRGLIVRNMGDRIAICPPLIIQPTEIDELFSRLRAALDAGAEELRAAGKFGG
jgi:4-aminobutyrate--pyruvate transaminase